MRFEPPSQDAPESGVDLADETRTWAREESITGFTAILKRLVAATPGSVAAALVDSEGEAVDYAGDNIDPFELKVAAAHWRIVLASLETGAIARYAGAPYRLIIRTTKRSFVLDVLPDGYALISILKQSAAFGHVSKALEAALQELHREAGWAAPPERFRWYEIEVSVEHGRPFAVLAVDEWVPVEVIGRVAAGLTPGETGYRVGVEHREVTLVLARDARWYSDLPPSELRT